MVGLLRCKRFDNVDNVGWIPRRCNFWAGVLVGESASLIPSVGLV